MYVVGHLPRGADGQLDLDRILLPVAGGRGLVAAVPFIRAIDVAADDSDPLATIYGEVIAEARARRAPGQALIVLGHLYVAGAEPSLLSERRVSIGGSEAASARLFPDDVDYVALGHLHRAQRVRRDTIRYAGAPLPLALDEARYHHSVAVVDFATETTVRTVPIPRLIDVVQIKGALDEVLVRIAELPSTGDGERPYLEVTVALVKAEPRLRATIERAVDGKHVRLVQLKTEHTGDGEALADRFQQNGSPSWRRARCSRSCGRATTPSRRARRSCARSMRWSPTSRGRSEDPGDPRLQPRQPRRRVRARSRA